MGINMCLVEPAPVADPYLPPPPKEDPKKSDDAVKRAREEELKRIRSLQGAGSTILTGAKGLSAPASTGKTALLGG
jgi:hypothetical protein